MPRSFLVRKDRKEGAPVLDTPHPYLLKPTKIGKRAYPLAQENGLLKWQSPDIAKDLSPFHGGSSPPFNYALNTNFIHPQPPNPNCVRPTSRRTPHTCRTKSSWLYATTKRPKRCRPLRPPPTNCRRTKTFYKRARSAFYLLPHPLPLYPHASPHPSTYPLNSNTPSLSNSRPQSWYPFYSCSLQLSSLFYPRLGMSLQFKIRLNWSSSSCRTDYFLRSQPRTNSS